MGIHTWQRLQARLRRLECSYVCCTVLSGNDSTAETTDDVDLQVTSFNEVPEIAIELKMIGNLNHVMDRFSGSAEVNKVLLVVPAGLGGPGVMDKRAGVH